LGANYKGQGHKTPHTFLTPTQTRGTVFENEPRTTSVQPTLLIFVTHTYTHTHNSIFALAYRSGKIRLGSMGAGHNIK